MSESPRYPKRLIEVDLPIKEISAHARREKSIRHGHISTLHIWWARRPLAACRAVICAALWPDPADELCPPAFREAAARVLGEFAEKARNDKIVMELCQPHWSRWSRTTTEALDPADLARWPQIRQGLLDFIADFANWDSSTVPAFLDAARALTQAAHEALGGAPGTKPLVVDPFAGGGSIPLEALRVGADAFASDLNPVAVLLNKVVLEYIPKYGQRLADEVRKWGEWIKKEAEKELAEFYPKDPDGATPIAYLWARTIQCEGPGCGAEVPLIRSLWLAKKSNRSVALQLVPRPRAKRVDFQIIVKQRGGWVDQDDPNEKIADPNLDGTVKRGSATCPCCGYTTAAERVRNQFKGRAGGASDARLLAVVTTKPDESGRHYRTTNRTDNAALTAVQGQMRRIASNGAKFRALFPHEPLPYLRSIFNIYLLDVKEWMSLFSPRQLLAISALSRAVQKAHKNVQRSADVDFSCAVATCLALAVDRQADYNSSLCRWVSAGEFVGSTFARQALGIIWDFAEVNPFGNASGDFVGAYSWVAGVCAQLSRTGTRQGHVEIASATRHPLPDDSVAAVISDPPYYDAVPYADLSDFFYVWLKRSLNGLHGPFSATRLRQSNWRLSNLPNGILPTHTKAARILSN